MAPDRSLGSIEGKPQIGTATDYLPGNWHHRDQVLFGIAQTGPAAFLGLDDYESDMPAFGGTVSDAETWAAIAFIKSTWSSSTRKRHDDINRRSGAE